MKVRWLKGATRSLRNIHASIAIENPQAAKKVADRVRSSTKRLVLFPSSGRVGDVSGTREVVVTGMPFIVVYRMVGEEVHILRVYHDAQQRPAVQ